jgi:hypothetical protein
MHALDFRERFLLLLSECDYNDSSTNPPMDWPAWNALRRGVVELLGEAGDEARCAHTDPLYQNKICLLCGRRPSAANTLPPEGA